MIVSTTSGFSKVLISPKLEVSLLAILRRIRRIILPERVLGNPDVNWILSSFAMGPICLLIKLIDFGF